MSGNMRTPLTMLNRLLMYGRDSRTSPRPTGTIESQVKATYKSLGSGWVCTFNLGLRTFRQLAPGKTSASNVYHFSSPYRSAIVRPVSSHGLPPCCASPSLDRTHRVFSTERGSQLA